MVVIKDSKYSIFASGKEQEKHKENMDIDYEI
jgi:hypothetical protein